MSFIRTLIARLRPTPKAFTSRGFASEAAYMEHTTSPDQLRIAHDAAWESASCALTHVSAASLGFSDDELTTYRATGLM